MLKVKQYKFIQIKFIEFWNGTVSNQCLCLKVVLNKIFSQKTKTSFFSLKVFPVTFKKSINETRIRVVPVSTEFLNPRFSQRKYTLSILVYNKFLKPMSKKEYARLVWIRFKKLQPKLVHYSFLKPFLT